MSPSWPGLHRRSILLISQPKEARTVPPGTGDSKRDFGEAVIGLPVPGTAVGHHHYPLRLSIPPPDQHGARREFSSLLVKASQAGGLCRSSPPRKRPIQHLPGFVIEIAKAISLDAIGDDCKQQVPR